MLSSAALSVVALAASVSSSTISTSVTPHAQYSSSIGVLGCKVNTNRIAYFPSWPSCDSMCLNVTANGRSVTILHVDTSGGAYDMSYDAWNYLVSGESATEDPRTGGGIPAEYEYVPMGECDDLWQFTDGKMALSAANSMGFWAGCPAGSWVRDNTVLYNIADPICLYGYDEVCQLPDLTAGANQPSCRHTLGSQEPLNNCVGCPVEDIAYGTGLAANAQ